MEVSDREKEKILDEQIRAAMTLLAVIYPPGCENVIELPGVKKSKYKLTLRSVIVNICKLIDKCKRRGRWKYFLDGLFLALLWDLSAVVKVLEG